MNRSYSIQKSFRLFALVKVSLMTLILVIVAFQEVMSQGIRPGVWRNATTQNAIKITINGDVLKYAAWREEYTMQKISENKYQDPNGFELELFHPDSIYLINEKYNMKQKLSLYAPDNYKNANPKVISYTKDGDTYYAVEKRDKEFVGTYKYKNGSNWGDPTIILNSDGSGQNQRHGVPADPVLWWGIETNYKGEVTKITGPTGNYKFIVSMRLANEQYDRAEMVVSLTDKKTIIRGERVFSWGE